MTAFLSLAPLVISVSSAPCTANQPLFFLVVHSVATDSLDLELQLGEAEQARMKALQAAEVGEGVVQGPQACSTQGS